MNTTTTTKTEQEAQKAEAEAKALASEVAELRHELKSLAEQVAKVGRTGAAELTTMAKAKAQEGLDAGHAIADEVRGELAEFNDQVVAATRENPWRSLGYAALAGVVFGLLIRR